MRKPRGRPRGSRGPGRPPNTSRQVVERDDSKPPALQVIIRGRGRGRSSGRGRGARGRGRGPGRPRGSTRGAGRGRRGYSQGRVGRPPLSFKLGRPSRGAINSIRGMKNKRINILTGLPEKMKLKDRVKKIKEMRLHKLKGKSSANSKDKRSAIDGIFGSHQKKPTDKETVLHPEDGKEYWNPPENIKTVLDSVLITDVTTDACTITIRESSSNDGFFRRRDQDLEVSQT
ncbi:hypothetical protein FSP39_013888 [Pinctada imbricata]|uniref:Uncharacterized protein n=1 Tax=Pinctada imbricata TaxID=66713 RepID=A0AA89BX33_PINIB|nr:hypothetical protein FSP39_013888 [Pinctada imbricata]